MAAASGMGAISSALWSSVVAGDEIVARRDPVRLHLRAAEPRHDQVRREGHPDGPVRPREPEEAALTDKTKVVYFETPCNPTLKLLDIAADRQNRP